MRMAPMVHLYPRYLTVEILKPLFTVGQIDTVRVAKKYVNQAIHNFVPMVILTPNGERIFYPKAIKKDGKKVKEVFKFENNPMEMYELEVPHSRKSDMERWQF